MPNVIDIEETLIEIKELPTYQAPQPAPEYSGLLNKLAAALKSMTVQSERPIEFADCRRAYEMPIDTLARKYPYEYAQALVG